MKKFTILISLLLIQNIFPANCCLKTASGETIKTTVTNLEQCNELVKQHNGTKIRCEGKAGVWVGGLPSFK